VISFGKAAVDLGSGAVDWGTWQPPLREFVVSTKSTAITGGEGGRNAKAK
jgi:hypothetical protein